MFHYSYTLEDQQLMSRAKNYFAWQARLVTPALGQRVIEIGCGIGNFTQNLLDREAVLALDVEAECVERTRARYSSAANLQVMQCEWGGEWEQGMRARIGGFRADCCVCLNVLEHIADDGEALRRMSDILQPGGVIVLIVPAFPALYGPIDKLLGHYRRYTRQSLQRLALPLELEVRAARYMNAAGFFGWWLNARVLKREVQSAAQIEIFDRYIVPWAARVERSVRAPFGQSLLAIFRKP